MEKMSQIPKLRFPEFHGEWERKKLGEIAEVFDGTHQTPLYVPKGIKFVSVEDINDIQGSKKFITEEAFKKGFKTKPVKDDILMTRITAGIIGATSIITNNEPIGFYVSLALIRKKEIIDVYYLNHFINCTYFKHELHKRIIHVAFPKKINLGDIGKCYLTFPSLPEQTKIASFLTEVDKKLTQLKEKKALLEKYKKGVMQKIFTQQLRYGNEFPEWEKKKLGDCLEYEQPTNYLVSSIEYDDKFKTPVVTAGKTFILGYTDEEYGIFEKLPVIIFDDFTTASQFVTFPFKAKSSAMKILKPKTNTNIKFIYEAIQMINYEIGGHGRHWISVFAQMNIEIPCIPEQAKIANFLTTIDEKIESVSKQIKGMEEWKKGLMQKMFC